jgi:hypothetical protein
MGAMIDDLATELLVRILRDKKLDARHLSLEDLQQAPPPEAVPESIFMIYLVSASSGEEGVNAPAAVQMMRARFTSALLVGVSLPGLVLQQGAKSVAMIDMDKMAASLVEALQICLDWLEERTKT